MQQFCFHCLPVFSTRLALFLGNTMENSGKQNPEMGFKSPPEQDGDHLKPTRSSTSYEHRNLASTLSLIADLGLSKSDLCPVLSNQRMHFPPRNACKQL